MSVMLRWGQISPDMPWLCQICVQILFRFFQNGRKNQSWFGLIQPHLLTDIFGPHHIFSSSGPTRSECVLTGVDAWLLVGNLKRGEPFKEIWCLLYFHYFTSGCYCIAILCRRSIKIPLSQPMIGRRGKSCTYFGNNVRIPVRGQVMLGLRPACPPLRWA